MPIELVPIVPPGDGVSAFTTKTNVRNTGGPINVDDYFRKDGANATQPQIDAAWLSAAGRTDAEIRENWRVRLRDRGVSYVSLESLLSSSPDEAQWLSETADYGIIVRGYEGRGSYDASPQDATGLDLDGKMASLRKQYKLRLAAIRDGSALIQMQDLAGVEQVLDVQAGLAPTAGDVGFYGPGNWPYPRVWDGITW